MQINLQNVTVSLRLQTRSRLCRRQELGEVRGAETSDRVPTRPRRESLEDKPNIAHVKRRRRRETHVGTTSWVCARCDVVEATDTSGIQQWVQEAQCRLAL